MKKVSYAVGGCGLFLLGCAAASVVQSSAMASPSPAPEGVTRWEYLCPSMPKDRQKAVNSLGAEGWEMVGNPSCFKRPLPTL